MPSLDKKGKMRSKICRTVLAILFPYRIQHQDKLPVFTRMRLNDFGL